MLTSTSTDRLFTDMLSALNVLQIQKSREIENKTILLLKRKLGFGTLKR